MEFLNSNGMRAFVAAAVLMVLSACSTGNGTLTCTASATQASTSPLSASVNVSCSGGSAPYSVTSLTIGGRTPTSVTGSASAFSGSTLLTAYDSTQTSFNGQSGTMMVVDSGSASGTYSFSVGTSTLTSGSTGCTLTPSTTVPTVNQSVTFSMAVTSSWGTAPYTFSSFTPGTYGVASQSPVSTSTTSATATAYYSSAGSVTPSVTVSDAVGNIQSCTTVLNVGGTSGSTGTLSCYLTQSVLSSGTVSFQATSYTGEPLTISNFSPGDGGTTTSSGNPIYASYSYAGQKTASAQAYSSSTGATCNSGAAFSVSFYLGTGTTGGSSGSLACTGLLSSNYVYRGQYVTASVSTSGGYGSVSLKQIIYPTNAGLSGSYTGPVSAYITFAYAGTYLLQFIVQDSYSTQATCTTSVTVY